MGLPLASCPSQDSDATLGLLRLSYLCRGTWGYEHPSSLTRVGAGQGSPCLLFTSGMQL